MDNFLLVLVAINLALFLWLGVLSFLYTRVLRYYRRIGLNQTEGDLTRLLEDSRNQTMRNASDVTNLGRKFEESVQSSLNHIQRVGFIRFNPFDETGGDQSFSLALLDAQGNGTVLSSLHGRDATRVYGKPVKLWKTDGYEFSSEEQQAIDAAKGSLL